MTTRVRFAPSPTGYLHIGGARTALFNWLYARQKGGTFVLRIEDTDVERSSDEMVEGILAGLRWLGLDWDEGPFFQSRRLSHYQEACQRLIAGGSAYYCFCSPESLEARKQAAQQAGLGWKYEGTCRDLSPEQVRARLAAGEPAAIRFKVPQSRKVNFTDLVFGSIEVDTEVLEDLVIQRSDGMPTYHLSVVVDDIDMGITHVVRGADHLSNTSKHVLLYEALGQPVPVYVHLPLILGPDKKRLSKRHGATSVMEYQRQGFVSDAVVNYLALLGWSPGTDQEIFTQDQLIGAFDLQRINKANAVFDFQKLEWMSGQYITAMTGDQLAPLVKPFLEAEGLWDETWEREQREWFCQLLELLKSRARRLTDFPGYGRVFLVDEYEYEPEAVKKYVALSTPEARASLYDALSELRAVYAGLTPFNLETTEQELRSIARKHGLKAGALIGAVRVALTGKGVAPGIFDVITLLGRDRTVQRLDRVMPLVKAPV